MKQRIDNIDIVEMEQIHIKPMAELEKHYFTSEAWSESQIAQIPSSPTTTAFVALKDGAFAGFVNISAVLDEATVNTIAVHPDFLKAGIGTALINYIKEKHYSSITLEVRKSNQTAISFYDKMGFEKVGERKNFYTKPTEDAILMTFRSE